MPLPLPLIGAAVSLTGILVIRRVSREEEVDDHEPSEHDTLRIRVRNARQKLRGRLRALGARKLEVWQHNLAGFVECHEQLKGLPSDAPHFRFRFRSETVALPALDAEMLDRMRRCGAEVLARDLALKQLAAAESDTFVDDSPPSSSDHQWQKHLPDLELLELGALGHTPITETIGDGETDCETLAWLAPDEPPAIDAPLFGGLSLSPETHAALRDDAREGDLRELRALLGTLESVQLIADTTLSALQDLDRACYKLLAELRMLVHINDDYTRMSDVALPSLEHSPRRLVQLSHQLTAVLLHLAEQPLLDRDGRLTAGVLRTTDISDAATARFA